MNSAGQCLDHVLPTEERLNSRYTVNFSSFALYEYSPRDLQGESSILHWKDNFGKRSQQKQ